MIPANTAMVRGLSSRPMASGVRLVAGPEAVKLWVVVATVAWKCTKLSFLYTFWEDQFAVSCTVSANAKYIASSSE